MDVRDSSQSPRSWPSPRIPVVWAVLVGVVGYGIVLSDFANDRASNNSARVWLRNAHAIYGPASDWDELLEDFDAAVVGTVVSISEPYWNSQDGRPWNGTRDTPIEVFSDVVLRITDVVRGPLAVGQTLGLLVRGDAKIRHESEDTPEYEAISGGFVLSENHLVLLRLHEFFFETGQRLRWTVAKNYQGNWRLSGNQAIGGDPRFSLGLVSLKEKLHPSADGSGT